MTKDEALKLALDALQDYVDEYGYDRLECFEHFTAIKEALAQPEQYPQIAISPEIVGYVAPQRTWVGLTDEEILAVNMSTVTKLIDEPIVCDTDHNIIQLGKAIEAKLKHKNT